MECQCLFYFILSLYNFKVSKTKYTPPRQSYCIISTDKLIVSFFVLFYLFFMSTLCNECLLIKVTRSETVQCCYISKPVHLIVVMKRATKLEERLFYASHFFLYQSDVGNRMLSVPQCDTEHQSTWIQFLLHHRLNLSPTHHVLKTYIILKQGIDLIGFVFIKFAFYSTFIKYDNNWDNCTKNTHKTRNR